MVKLDISSSIDAKQYPFLREWDFEMRKNHSKYQQEIDKLTYHLQRTQRGLLVFGQIFYPFQFQKDLLALQVYRAKQLIGRINQDEVDQYKRLDPTISDALNRTFSASWPLPVKGTVLGVGAFAFAHVFNYQYSFRLAFFAIPVVVDIFLQLGDKSSYFKSLDFLDWLKTYRIAKARLELDKPKLDNDLLNTYKQTIKSSYPFNETYRQYIELVTKEVRAE